MLTLGIILLTFFDSSSLGKPFYWKIEFSLLNNSKFCRYFVPNFEIERKIVLKTLAMSKLRWLMKTQELKQG